MKRLRRRGVTLVETIAAMTVLMIVAGVAAALIESLYHIERAGLDHATYEAEVARVAQAFRADVRAFPNVSIDKHLTLVDSDPKHVVCYRVRGDQIGRFEWFGATMLAHDWYPLPPRAAPRFEKSPDDASLVSLWIDRRVRKEDQESISRPVRIEAVLGADRRFERTRP